MKLTDEQLQIINEMCDYFEENNIEFNMNISLKDFMTGYWKTQQEIELAKLREERKNKLNNIYEKNK